MPEIAEVARIVHFLRQKLVGRTISTAIAVDDGNVFGKVGTSGQEVEAALKGKKVISAGSQGKYFWIILSKPPHLVMHFGMTGWVHIKGERTAYTNYYNKLKASDMDPWPPRFWKFHVATTDDPPVEVAFVDSRRFARVRLVDCPGADIRQHSPLVENGPDPVVDRDRFTESYLAAVARRRRVPIKSLLLDQTTISGIGNWVADETLYQARLHPEQHADTLTEGQVATLYAAIRHVCQTAVDRLGDSDRFPDTWLFKHRWGKGDTTRGGGASVLPNGERLAFVTVGGRTSCYAPGVQRKTGDESVKVEAEAMDGETLRVAKRVIKKKKKEMKMVMKAVQVEEVDVEGAQFRYKKRRSEPIVVKEEEDSSARQGFERMEHGRRRSSRLMVKRVRVDE